MTHAGAWRTSVSNPSRGAARAALCCKRRETSSGGGALTVPRPLASPLASPQVKRPEFVGREVVSEITGEVELVEGRGKYELIRN